MKLLSVLCLLAMVSSVLAQPTLRIGANTRLVGSGAAQLMYTGAGR